MAVASASWAPEHPLRAVLDTALDAVIVMDVDGMVRGWNGCAERTFGFSAAEAVGRPLADLIIPPQYRDAHWNGLRRYLETGEGPVLNQHIEVSALHRDGREFPLELSITPTHYGAGAAFLGFLRDISERKAAQAAVERRARDAELMLRVASLAAETDSLDAALEAALDAILEITGWPLGHAFRIAGGDPPGLEDSGVWRWGGEDGYAALREATAQAQFLPGVGLPGLILQRREPVWIEQTDAAPSFFRARVAARCGLHAAFGFPIVSSGRPIAILEFFSRTAAPPDAELLLTVRALGQQVGRVFERKEAEDRLRADKAALEQEVRERRALEHHRELLLGELNHRVKNVLAVVAGIAAQTARASPTVAAFSESFGARLRSLAQAHDLLTERSWLPTPLRAVAEAVLDAYLGQGGRVSLEGPELSLEPKAAVSLGLVLHELMTNAVKHGALAGAEGAVRLRWEAPEPSQARLVWSESGVAGLTAPGREGFGFKMISVLAPRDLGGRAGLEWRPEGVEYELCFPAAGNLVPDS
ncbi:MAG TPA: HWE histidine kinase domain-containing protein [Caulobacteraceae bacterium]|jgi:PAS domain S-box-containing protein